MSGAPPRPTDPAPGRAKLFQPGTMTADGAEHRIHLLHIASDTACLHVDLPPAVGTVVRIVCGLSLGPAQVVGVNGRYVEVAFRIPLSAMTVDRLVQAHGALRTRISEVPPLAR